MFVVELNGVQMSSQLSADIPSAVLLSSLAGVNTTAYGESVSELLVVSAPHVPRYDSLLHIHLENHLKHIDQEQFEAFVVEAVNAANEGTKFHRHWKVSELGDMMKFRRGLYPP